MDSRRQLVLMRYSSSSIKADIHMLYADALICGQNCADRDTLDVREGLLESINRIQRSFEKPYFDFR